VADPLVTRLAWADRAKGIAILLVVLHHVVQFSGDQQWASANVAHVNSMLQTFRMPLFFAMSGLFFGKAVTKPWRWLLINRVLPFAYLYVLWAVVWHACFEVMPVKRVGLSLDYLTTHLSDPGVGPWYLYALALYFIVAKALSPLPPWIQLAITVAISVPVAARLIVPPVWAWEYIGMYGVAFFAGMHGRQLLTRLADRTTLATVALAAGGWGVGTAVMYSLAPPVGRYLFVPLCAAGIALGVTLAAMSGRASLLGWLGRRTLPIYLLHQPLIGAIYSIAVVRSLPDSPWVVAGVLVCTWVVVVVAAVVIWRVTNIVPGLFVAPWYGAGNATMSRAPSRAIRRSVPVRPGTGAPGPGRHRG
jgi:uncharacterized membrane protein YcfT